jgi:hypothetical protein
MALKTRAVAIPNNCRTSGSIDLWFLKTSIESVTCFSEAVYVRGAQNSNRHV